MPKDKKDSRFDRVETGRDIAKKVMKDMDNPKSPWSKDKATDMVSRFGSGGIKHVAQKVASKVIPATKTAVSKISENGKMFVQHINEVKELGRKKGVHTIKTTAGEGKGSEKKIAMSIKRGDDLGFKSIGKPKSSELGATSRGKQIGKPITDQGGKRRKK